MSARGFRVSQPIYEALPYIYIVCGLAALVASYFHVSKLLSYVLGIPGWIGLLGGVVVILRRRDYRQRKANNYLNSEDLPKNEE